MQGQGGEREREGEREKRERERERERKRDGNSRRGKIDAESEPCDDTSSYTGKINPAERASKRWKNESEYEREEERKRAERRETKRCAKRQRGKQPCDNRYLWVCMYIRAFADIYALRRDTYTHGSREKKAD